MRLTQLFPLLLAFVLAVPVIAVELPAVPGSPAAESQTRGMYGNATTMLNDVINPSRQAIAYLNENPFYPDRDEWRRVIAMHEIRYIHHALVFAVQDKNSEVGNVVMERLRELCPTINTLNLRNPQVLRQVTNFMSICVYPTTPSQRNQTREWTYAHPQAILKIRDAGLRFRTAQEAAAGGVVTPPANDGLEFLNPTPPETDFLGNPVTK